MRHVELYVDRKNILCVMFLGDVEDISASKRVTGDWRILRYEALHVLCCLH